MLRRYPGGRVVVNNLRAIARPIVLAAVVGWSVVVLFAQTFKGANVGGPACNTDPTCGEVGWVPVVVWLGGCLIIFGLGYWTGYRDRSG